MLSGGKNRAIKGDAPMDKATLVSGIGKLAKAVQQAGFSVEQMIQLLNSRLGMEGLMKLIAWRLEQPGRMAPVSCSSCWIV
jgi:hypothetical protein